LVEGGGGGIWGRGEGGRGQAVRGGGGVEESRGGGRGRGPQQAS